MNEENIQEQTTDIDLQGGAAVATEAPPQTEVPEEPIGNPAEELERQIAEQELQDQRLLAALDEVLEKRSRQMTNEQKRPKTRTERVAAAVQKKGVGFVSLGLILVFMGIVMINVLSASTPNYTVPLKLSPICAILIGAEILINQVLTRGRFRVSVPSIIISVVFVVGCCVLCAKLGGDYKEEVFEYNNRTVAGEIYDRSYVMLKDIADISTVKVDVVLNPDGKGKVKGVDALSSSDIVDVSVEFGGVYYTPEDFAEDCKKVIEQYRTMGIHITDFHFANKSKLRSYTLDVEGKFEQDLSKSRLEEMVNYIYVDDYDYIEDLEDYVESTDTSS